MKSRLKFLVVATFILALSLWLYSQYYFNPAGYLDSATTVLEKETVTSKENVAEVYRAETAGPKNFNVILFGIDARNQESSRTDLIMLFNVNPRDKTVLALSIPRDTRVELPGVGLTKINHAHLLGEIKGGTEKGTWAALQAVSELMQCRIDYYVKLNFDAFSSFIDAIGGIEIDLEYPVTLTFVKETLPAGRQRLGGETALKLVRERYSLADGDFGRQRLQFLVLKTMAYKLLEPSSLLKLPFLFENIKDNVDTNLNVGEVISLARAFQKLPAGSITHMQLPGTGGYAPDQLLQGSLYFWFADAEQIQEISRRFRNP